MSYKLTPFGVQRLQDSALIPNDTGNRDWASYQQWLAAGNTPAPADVKPAVERPLTVEDLAGLLKKKGHITDSDLDEVKLDERIR